MDASTETVGGRVNQPHQFRSGATLMARHSGLDMRHCRCSRWHPDHQPQPHRGGLRDRPARTGDPWGGRTDHCQARRGPRGPALRGLPRDRADHRAALGQPCGAPCGIGADPQQGDPDGQGQRLRRQPDRDAAVVVWQVRDSAEATYSVEDFVAFVNTQSETALRHMANGHPYDNGGRDDVMSLRDHTDEIAGQLAPRSQPGSPGRRRHHRGQDHPAVLHARDRPGHAAAPAGRGSCRSPVPDRRRRCRHGPDGARPPLDENIVELDEERKAAMVSNLLVVLCGDRGTQPIVNAGSLYQ